MRIMCRRSLVQRFFSVAVLISLATVVVQAQNTRPRRTGKTTTKTTTSTGSDPLLRPEPAPSPTARKTSSSDSLLDVQPVKPVVNTVGAADTRQAYLLLEQKQFAAAAKAASSA